MCVSTVQQSRVTFVLYLVLEVTCSVLKEVERLCCTWPAVPQDEHGGEQRQEEAERGSSMYSVAMTTCLFTWGSAG